MDYDDFGRIMRLLRYDGKGRVIDSLAYQYLNNTGRLGHVRDGVGSAVSGNDVDNQMPNNYAYDASGNMTQDLGSGIGEIRYNPYNLPTTLIKSGQTYQYRYDGSGKRIEKVQPNGTFESYRRGANGELFAIYDNVGALKQFELDGMGEARFVTGDAQQKGSSGATSGNWQFLYYDKDILGNNRMLIKQDGTIARTFDPEPWGYEETRRTFGNTTVDNKFTGKQNDRETGLDYFGARYYNNKTASWLQSEPLYQKYPSITPYNYGLNNPLRHIDVDGRDVYLLNNSKGAAGFGHAAVLIGNDKIGYKYYSRDGTKDNFGITGKAEYTIKSYSTLVDFSNSHEIKQYDRAVFVSSTESQDKSAINLADAIIENDYDLKDCNCADLTNAVLEKFDIKVKDDKTLGATEPNKNFEKVTKEVERQKRGTSIKLKVDADESENK